jgi:hypothetical protein
VENTSIRLAAFDCLTAFGDVGETYRALCDGRRAIELRPVLGSKGGDLAPLALCAGRSLDETAPPQWIGYVKRLAATIPMADWGSPRRPVFVTSSNFGVGNLYAYRQTGDASHLTYGTPSNCIEWLRDQLGWGPNVTTFSHACVSAHLGLLQGTRLLRENLADEALIFSFDFLSPFVAGGFNALKILNSDFPAPYENRATGSIALGDGLAYAVLSRDAGDFAISGQTLHNEMYHFTANQSDGLGFAACIQTVKSAAAGKRVWLKGHGTGTLDAGRLESKALCDAFPEAPLVAWKGSLGHTLGSCGLVELAIAARAIAEGLTPGTIGSSSGGFSENVAFAAFPNRDYDGAVCTSNAFGGAHAAFLLTRG